MRTRVVGDGNIPPDTAGPPAAGWLCCVNSRVYSVAHEEVETLPRNIKKGLRYCDFKYALDDHLVEVLKVLNLLGLDRPDPVSVKGVEVVPRDVVTALLPRFIDLGGKIKGWSCVGPVIRGAKAGVEKEYYVYTMSSHDEAYQRLGVNATAYQTGIPPVVIAEMIAEGASRAMVSSAQSSLTPSL